MEETKLIGQVSWFDEKKGFGVINYQTSDDNEVKQYFAHHSEIYLTNNIFKALYKDETTLILLSLSVSFDEITIFLRSLRWLQFKLSHVLLPIIKELLPFPIVNFLNFFKSLPKLHGILFFSPIPPRLDNADIIFITTIL